MSIPEVLRSITETLDRAAIPYMLTGSMASAYYGAPRTTQDIDFVIAPDPEGLRTFVQLLPTNKYYVDLDAALQAHRHRSMFNLLDMESGWKIDLIFRKARVFDEGEFRRRKEITLHGVVLFAATPEDVVISKLEWAKMAQSQRQIEDVAGVLRIRSNSLDQSYIERWIRELELTSEWNDARRTAHLQK
jgi:hypothetical protein